MPRDLFLLLVISFELLGFGLGLIDSTVSTCEVAGVSNFVFQMAVHHCSSSGVLGNSFWM
jgi:hypothetical protein